VAIAARLGLLNADGHPAHLLKRAWRYYPWLLGELIKSSWQVAKLTLHPGLPISPTMTVLTAGQRTEAGVATYANSITLTPGTLTVGVRGKEIAIHALVRSNAADLKAGTMDRRVSKFEGTA
jgi:multicomponent Na+:H+ antiporter subunit E